MSFSRSGKTWGIIGLVILAGIFVWVRTARLWRWKPQRTHQTLSVFAAASLSESFQQMGKVFESMYPGILVEPNYAGSQMLVLQIQQGAAADVFVSADLRWMQELEGRGLLNEAAAKIAYNSLVVVAPKRGAFAVQSLQDLARPGVKLVLAADAVPVGRYSREALNNLSRLPGFPDQFAARVIENVVSNEENVKSVLGKVVLGEADAGIVYQSDVTPAISDQVRVLPIPVEANVVATYMIAVLRSALNRKAAEEFVRFVQSTQGQRILANFGFIPVRPVGGN